MIPITISPKAFDETAAMLLLGSAGYEFRTHPEGRTLDLRLGLLGVFLLIGRNVGDHALVERDLLHLARHVAHID